MADQLLTQETTVNFSGLEGLSIHLDSLSSSLDNKNLAAKLDIPPSKAHLFRFRKAQSPESGEPATVVHDIGAEPAISISCFEIRSGKKQLFTIITQDEEDQWHLYVQESGQFQEIKNSTTSPDGQEQIVWKDPESDHFRLGLYPLDTEGMQLYARFVTKVTDGNSAEVRPLPVQMVREALKLPQKEKMKGTPFYYFSITEGEMKKVLSKSSQT